MGLSRAVIQAEHISEHITTHQIYRWSTHLSFLRISLSKANFSLSFDMKHISCLSTRYLGCQESVCPCSVGAVIVLCGVSTVVIMTRSKRRRLMMRFLRWARTMLFIDLTGAMIADATMTSTRLAPSRMILNTKLVGVTNQPLSQDTHSYIPRLARIVLIYPAHDSEHFFLLPATASSDSSFRLVPPRLTGLVVPDDQFRYAKQ